VLQKLYQEDGQAYEDVKAEYENYAQKVSVNYQIPPGAIKIERVVNSTGEVMQVEDSEGNTQTVGQ
jgi:hypothetical protein